MDGRLYYQKTFKYPAQTYAVLQDKFLAVANCAELVKLLDECSCLEFLQPEH